MQGAVLLIEASCMTPALVIALFQQDGDAWALGATMLILIAIGAPCGFWCGQASGICARGRAS